MGSEQRVWTAYIPNDSTGDDWILEYAQGAREEATLRRLQVTRRVCKEVSVSGLGWIKVMWYAA